MCGTSSAPRGAPSIDAAATIGSIAYGTYQEAGGGPREAGAGMRCGSRPSPVGLSRTRSRIHRPCPIHSRSYEFVTIKISCHTTCDPCPPDPAFQESSAKHRRVRPLIGRTTTSPIGPFRWLHCICIEIGWRQRELSASRPVVSPLGYEGRVVFHEEHF